MLQGFTLKQIADSNHVSKSTIKSFAATHGFKPIGKSGNAYIYSDDLMAVVAEKYGEPANSAKLFDQAVSASENADIKTNNELKKQVSQLRNFAIWWAELDDQRLVPVYIYRYIFNSKIIRKDECSVKIMQFFGAFSLNPANEKLEHAVNNGTFEFFVWRFYRLLGRPSNAYVMISNWGKCSDGKKHSIIHDLDNALAKNYKTYRNFQTGSTDSGGVQGAGVKTPAISAGSSSTSDDSEVGRCKTALLADKKSTEKGA